MVLLMQNASPVWAAQQMKGPSYSKVSAYHPLHILLRKTYQCDAMGGMHVA